MYATIGRGLGFLRDVEPGSGCKALPGYIVPEYYKFPGYLSPSLGLKFADVPNGLAALSK